MSAAADPLVGIVTPVCNGEHFLRECVESVLRQTYRRWTYIIVNNASTDRTGEIAEAYAARDPRIRVVDNPARVSAIRNHEIGFRAIPAESRYCKVVHADDWLFPECLERMVALAEAHPSVGLVGAYGLAMDRVVWDGLPYPSTVVDGREMARRYLLGGPFVFGSPTSVLYRADLVRARRPFYREACWLWADTDACLDVLAESDFGFVHQVLTFTRTHPEAISSTAVRLNTYLFGQLELLTRYGPVYLTPEEQRRALAAHLHRYRRFLGRAVFERPRDREFWTFHLGGLRRLGHPVRAPGLAAAAAAAALAGAARPLRTAGRLLRRAASRPADPHPRAEARADAVR